MIVTPTDPQQFGSSAHPDDLTLVKPQRSSRRRSIQTWFWSVVWLSLLATCGALGVWAIAFITRLPPVPECDRISRLSSDSERLYCARQAAVSGAEQDLVAGVQLVASWEESHPLYQDSEIITNRWSKDLFKVAQQRMQAGYLERAIELLGYIPQRAKIYPEIAATLEQWQQEWTAGQDISADVKNAVSNQNWSGAREKLQTIKQLTSDHWLQDTYQYLEQHIETEEAARRDLLQAQSLADSGDRDQLVEAMTLARQLNVQSHAWSEAQPLVAQWAETLLDHGMQQWEQDDLSGAIATMQQVPMDLVTRPEAKDLVQLAHARRLAASGKQWMPSYGDIVNLMDAIQAIQGIGSDSPFATEADVKLDQWTQQLQDLQQLYGAVLVANLDQKPSLQAAIAEAQTINEGRPQRQQAQTLIAHWSKEIERIEDRPILIRAQRIADKGDKTSLQAAIAAAQTVELGRALRIDAQTKVAQWTKQIQVLEDQPLYSKALELASQGLLPDAITAARKIQPGRALYRQAQTSIRQWTARIQIAEDRPILEEAESLAYQGRLTEAIALAYRIGPSRALYNEAISSITIWEAERAYIESQRAPADETYDDDYYEDPDPSYE